MNKHAYLIVAHDKFDQLAFLLSLLDHPQHDFFIHIDKKVAVSSQDLDKVREATQHSAVHFLPRMSVRWGHYSLIDCEVRLIEAAYQTGPYSMYHLISGVDLPLASPQKIYDFFTSHQDKIFITRFNQEEIKELKLHKLVEHYHLSSRFDLRHLSPFAQKLLRFYRRMENKVQTALGVDRLKGHREDWGVDFFSNWKSMNHEVAHILLAERPFIQKQFRYTFCTDELYFPMVLKRAGLLDKIYHYEPVHDVPDELQGNLRFINWWDGHPYEWTDSEKDLAQLDKGIALGHLFSRKFNLQAYPALKDYILSKVRDDM